MFDPLVVVVTLVILETLLLIVITVVLFKKTQQITKLAESVSSPSASSSPVASNDDTKIDKDFIPMMVHELRSPLSVIKGASDLILKEVDNMTAEQIHTLLSQIRTSSSGLLQLVNDILDVAKMDAGKFDINKTFANIDEVLEEECVGFRMLADTKNVKLVYKGGDKFSSFGFDPQRIKQVMNNLLSNAVKFTHEDGTIEVIHAKKGKNVEITIADSGVGISDEDKKHLFHKFVQAHNHAGVEEKGTGLGLVISKAIVEAHGGKLWVEDNKPQGSKFIFTLPLS